jgi:hypothetical protein
MQEDETHENTLHRFDVASASNSNRFDRVQLERFRAAWIYGSIATWRGGSKSGVPTGFHVVIKSLKRYDLERTERPRHNPTNQHVRIVGNDFRGDYEYLAAADRKQRTDVYSIALRRTAYEQRLGVGLPNARRHAADVEDDVRVYDRR